MQRKTVSAICVLILLLSYVGVSFQFIRPARASETIYIKADGTIDPPTPSIQRDGNVYIFTESIYDSILVERDDIVVDGAGYTLEGEGSGRGIDLTYRSNVTVANATVKNFDIGIWLESSNYNSITNNNITANWAGTALMDFSNNNIISGNNITDNREYGLDLSWSSNNSIIGNKFTNDGLTIWYSYQNSVENNTVNGKPLVYLEGVSNYSVIDAGQAILVKSDNIRVEGFDLSETGVSVQLWETDNSIVGNNIAENSSFGIWIHFSSNNSIVENSITENNIDGIWLQHSSNNSIVGNNITNNDGYGIRLDESSGNTLQDNVLTNNEYGVRLYFSSDNSIVGNDIAENSEEDIWVHFSSHNKIYHNNFISVLALTPEHTNTWDDGYPSGGNYWSDYNPPDEDFDKIGDTPYTIDENNADRYPLIYPYGFAPNPDVNNDKAINILDISTVAIAFGCKPGDLRWNSIVDMDLNETINILDLAAVAMDYGKTV